ncbi:Ig-like domain repeat protein [Methanobrevibacter sp.]
MILSLSAVSAAEGNDTLDNGIISFDGGMSDLELDDGDILSADVPISDNLPTVEEGVVSGGIDLTLTHPWAASDPVNGNKGNITYDIPSTATDIKFAYVYVNIYSGSAATTYGSVADISINTASGYLNSTENLWISSGTTDGVNYIVNDHITKCYSDYMIFYNITDLVRGFNGTSVSVNVLSRPMEGKSFDGRIKLISLIMAYDDDDSDVFNYWFNAGQGWTNNELYTFFDTSNIDLSSNDWDANLTNVALSSYDGLYIFNNEFLFDDLETDSGAYYQFHKWNVNDYLIGGTEELKYISSQDGWGSFKTVFSILTIQQPPKPEPFISISANNIQYGQTATIIANLASGVTGNVRFVVDGKSYTSKITNGAASVSVSGLKAGSYTVSATYDGNAQYGAQTLTKNLKVNKINPITSIVANNINYSQDAIISVNLNDNVNGNVRITVDGTTYVCKINNGFASAVVSGLKVGSYPVSVKYAGATNFNAQTVTSSFDVSKANPIVSVLVGDVYVGDDAVVSVNLVNGVNGNVRITVDGTTYVCKINNGFASAVVSGLKVGSYPVSVKYAGNTNFNAQTVTSSFDVSKANPIVSVLVGDVYVGDDAVVSVSLVSGVNGNVRITVDGTTYVCKINNEIASVSIPNLKAGSYSVSAKYAGNTKFNAQTVTTSFNVNKINPFVSFSAEDIFVGENGVVSVNLANGVNGNVRITIDGTTYVCKITNGVASVSVANLKAGSYPITIKYAGTAKFNAQTVTTTLNVNKIDPIVSVSANNVNYGNDAVVRVNLLNGVNGNVRVTVDGVTYVCKISNGLASATIPGLNKGTYSVKVAYAGTAKYNAQTIMTTLKVL